jgi:putative MATE family efflux protein
MPDDPPKVIPSAGGAMLAAAPQADTLGVIWSLAWPVIIAMSVESVVGLIDMLMVGRLGPNAVAAVGVGTQILFTVSAGMIAVGTGALALVARYVGAGDRGAAEGVLAQSIVVGIGAATVLILPILIWAPWIMGVFGVDEAVVHVGSPYVRLLMLGVPADAMIFIVALGLRGAGDTRTPLLVSVVIAVVKVVSNYVLIFGKLGMPALGVVGAAAGTVLAFAGGALLIGLLLLRGDLVLRITRKNMRLRGDTMRRVLSIGYPAAIEHVAMQAGFVVYIVFASRYGTSAVAAYFIGVRILALSFLPGFGFSAAAAALVGQNLGAGRPRSAERSGWNSTRLATYLMTVGGALIFLAARPFARLFVDDEEVIADAISFIYVLAAVQPLMAIDFTLGGALRGAGDTRFPLLAVILGFYGCRLGFATAVTFWWGLGLFWLWFALVGDYLARSVLKGYRFHSGRWQTIAV